MEKVVAQNTLYQVISKVCTAGIGFFLTLLIASVYGAAFYGDFTKVTTIVSLFYLLIDFGLNAVFLQFEEVEEKFSSLLLGRIAGAILLILFVNTFFIFFPLVDLNHLGFSHSLRSALFIFSLTIISQAIIFSCSSIFQKNHEYNKLLVVTLVSSAVTLLGTLTVSIFHFQLPYILASYAFGSMIGSLVAIAYCNQLLKGLKVHSRFLLALLQKSWPLGSMLVFNLIYFRIDILLLSFFRLPVEVGLYGYAYKFFDFLLTIPLFVSNSLYPFLLNQKTHQHLVTNKKKYLLIYISFSIVLTVISILVAPSIALVREEFLPSVNVLIILLLSLPVFFLTNLLQWNYIAKQKQGFLLKVYAVGMFVTLLLNYFFIPIYGMYAAAWITSFGEVVILLLLWMPLLRKNP